MSATITAVAEKSKRKATKPVPAGESSSKTDASSESPSPPKKRKREENNAEPTVPSASNPAEDNSADHVETADPEMTVLSHAQVRKERKQKRKLEDHSESKDTSLSVQQASSSKNVSATNADSSKKRQNSVWVGNLAFKTTEKQLEHFFEFAGEITRTNMPMKRGEGGGSQNRGFAYVDFATPEAKAEAITYSERNLDGRRLLIKDGNDFNGRPALDPTLLAIATASISSTLSDPSSSKSTPSLSHFAQKILQRQKQPPAPTLFVGNLSFEATEDSIRAMVEAHERHRAKKAKEKAKRAAKRKIEVEGSGTDSDEEDDEAEGKPSSLAKVRVGQFEDSGNCKGFAFLDFKTTQEATAALLDPRNHSMDGRELKLEYAGADAVRRSGLHESKDDKKPKAKGGGVRTRRDSGTNGVGDSESRPPKRAKFDDQNARRKKPGAALAGAPREQAGIVESTGTKTKF